MMKLITKKNFLIASAFAHCALFIVTSALSSGSSTPHTIEAPSFEPQEVIKAKSTSQEDVDRVLEEMNQEELAWQKELEKKQAILEQTESSLAKAKKETAKKKKELQKINESVIDRQNELDQLKKNSEIKAKKEAEEKSRKLAEEKEAQRKREEELRRAKEREAQLAKTKAENSRLLEEAKARKQKEQTEKKARLRSAYERSIKLNLFDNWNPPLRRADVICKVKLEVSKSGEILGFKFINNCPADYATSIKKAISKTGILTTPPQIVYERFEEVNFVDKR